MAGCAQLPHLAGRYLHPRGTALPSTGGNGAWDSLTNEQTHHSRRNKPKGKPMNNEIKSQQPRRPGRPKGSKNRIKRTKPLTIDDHVNAVLCECALPATASNRLMVDALITTPDSKLIQQSALGQRVRNHGAPRLTGRLAHCEALEVARAEMLPTVRMAAIERAPSALNLLIKFVTGEESAPAAVRRLAALDILALAGLTTGPAQPEPGTQKPVCDLTADELRAILAQQQGTLAELQQGLSGNVIEADKVPEQVH